MDAEQSLEAVRRKIDAIDDSIHDLIMQRTELVEKVKDLKRDMPIKIRPSREAEIVYRLMRQHKGRFPRRELTAIWRHLIMATLCFEGPFSVAVFMPSTEGAYWDLARDHFGIFTPMARFRSARAVIEAIEAGNATVGVLPMPRQDDPDPWWPLLMSGRPNTPRVIARLPFAGPSNGLGGDLEALAVCPVAVTATSRDRTYIALDIASHLDTMQFEQEMSALGLAPLFSAVWNTDQGPRSRLGLAEIDGFLSPDDLRLRAASERIGASGSRAIVVGGYATPLALEELETQPTGTTTQSTLNNTETL